MKLVLASLAATLLACGSKTPDRVVAAPPPSVAAAQPREANETEKNRIALVSLERKDELTWTSPTGEQIELQVKYAPGQPSVEILANNRVIDTIDLGDLAADGKHTTGGSIGADVEGVLAIAGIYRPREGIIMSWQARTFRWDDRTRTLTVEHKLTWEQEDR